MSPNLQRCMKQAREFPNTATVDILIAAVEKELADEREACAGIAEARSKNWTGEEIAVLIRARGNPAPVESDESYEASEALLNARRGA